MGRPFVTLRLAADGLPMPVRWRPVFKVGALVAGAILDLGIELALQQAGLQVFEAPQVVRGVLVGAALGVILPSTGLWFGVRTANREIGQARAATDSGADAVTQQRERDEAFAAARQATDAGARGGDGQHAGGQGSVGPAGQGEEE